MTAQPLANSDNIQAIDAELNWLEQVIDQAIRSYLKHEGHENDWRDIAMPDITQHDSVYGRLCADWCLGQNERVLLALTLAPNIRPQMLDIFFGVNGMTERAFTEFGGVADKAFSGFMPTGQTLRFILCFDELEHQADLMALLSPAHRLMAEQVIGLGGVDEGIPASAGVLYMSEHWVEYFLTGIAVRPELSASFPAHPLLSPLQWQDLVVEHNLMVQIEEIRDWLQHGETLMQQLGLDKKIKPGYRALFFGPPGTGKTLTATLLGQSTGREVYRVDLSMIVSKYIGETEKNLARVFEVASYKNWILFFDEADALFGRRTEANNSNDRHANQQTGYLLQRIEDFPGVVILATNLKANMDDAFTRRFQAMIHFTMPGPSQRLQLWQNAFADALDLDSDVDLTALAKEYELAGGAIINVLRYCALAAIKRGERLVRKMDVREGIRREFRKDNRTIR